MGSTHTELINRNVQRIFVEIVEMGHLKEISTLFELDLVDPMLDLVPSDFSIVLQFAYEIPVLTESLAKTVINEKNKHNTNIKNNKNMKDIENQ